jgi:hypothetical protein
MQLWSVGCGGLLVSGGGLVVRPSVASRCGLIVGISGGRLSVAGHCGLVVVICFCSGESSIAVIGLVLAWSWWCSWVIEWFSVNFFFI